MGQITDAANQRPIENIEYVMIISALVQQLGGAVVLDEGDLLQASASKLHTEAHVDPWRLVLKVEHEGNV